jgi:hypothetical protein
VTEVPPTGTAGFLDAVGGDESWTVVVVLLLVMAGFVYAFVESFGEKDPAVLVVLALVIGACGALVFLLVRKRLAGQKTAR